MRRDRPVRSWIPPITAGITAYRQLYVRSERGIGHRFICAANLADAGPPVRVSYALTKKGEGLWKVVEEIGKWADRWLDGDS